MVAGRLPSSIPTGINFVIKSNIYKCIDHFVTLTVQVQKSQTPEILTGIYEILLCRKGKDN